MKTCGCPPNRKCHTHLRQIALSESRALRLLHVLHGGRVVKVAPTDWGAPT